MITLHALKYSRATRVLWLLNDLGQPCARIDYPRTEAFGAPDTLAKVHPLGKSPVIVDGDEMIAESATILRYLVDKYADETHRPPAGTADYWRHEAFFDYVEASFAGVAVKAILPAFSGEQVADADLAALDKNLEYISEQIGDGPLLFGSQLMLADIQLSYLLALLDKLDLFGGHDRVKAYWDRLRQQPGYIAAVEAAGPMAP